MAAVSTSLPPDEITQLVDHVQKVRDHHWALIKARDRMNAASVAATQATAVYEETLSALWAAQRALIKLSGGKLAEEMHDGEAKK